jgi:hypothetical protein
MTWSIFLKTLQTHNILTSVLSLCKLTNLSWIERLKMKFHSKARFRVPICKMISMPIMHPTLLVDIWKMEASFQMGYKEGDGCKWDKTSHIRLLWDCFCDCFLRNIPRIFLKYYWKSLQKSLQIFFILFY